MKTSISVHIHILLGIYTVLRFLFRWTSNTASRLFHEVPKGGLIHLSMSFLSHVLALPLLVVDPLVIPCSFLPFFRYFLHDNRTLIIPHSHFIHFCLTLGRLKTTDKMSKIKFYQNYCFYTFWDINVTLFHDLRKFTLQIHNLR